MRFGERHVNVVAQFEANHLTRQNFRARTELNKLDLAFGVVENSSECVVHELELRLIEPECHRKFQLFRHAAFDERVMKLAIVIQVARIAINRLLKITDHREMTGPRSLMSILSPGGWTRCGEKPLATRTHRPRHFKQNKKLLRICVLSFVENDAIMFATNSLRHLRQPQQFGRERDLVRISYCATT